jgi:NitT/TauT family transport system permease protein
VTAVEQARGDLAGPAVDLSGDQARAERVAAARRHRRQLINLAIRVVSLAIALALWEVAAWNVDPVLFTSPSKVAVAAYHMVLSGELWTYLWPSLVVLAIGFAFAVVAGIGIGLLLARFSVLDVALTVYITFLYSIPSVALVPLIVLWAGFDTTAKVIILFLFAFFLMVINTYQGVKSVDPKLLEVGRAFRCSERQLWANIVLPGALPFIVTGIRLAVGRGMIGMVLADLYTAISGIGYLIVRTASTFQVDKMFVPIVTLGLLGVTFTAMLRLAENTSRPGLRRRKTTKASSYWEQQGVPGKCHVERLPNDLSPLLVAGVLDGR